MLETYWLRLDKILCRNPAVNADIVIYAKNQKPNSSAFLEHIEVEISNNYLLKILSYMCYFGHNPSNKR